MAYPGLAFTVMLGVVVGAALYAYFTYEPPVLNAHHNPPNHEPTYDRWGAGDQPASTSSTSSTTRRQRRKQEKCTICMDDLGTQNLNTTECGHQFHQHCITMWFRQSKSCPNCRTRV